MEQQPNSLRRMLEPTCRYAYGIGYGFAAAGVAMILLFASYDDYFLVLGALVLLIAFPMLVTGGVLEVILFFHGPISGQVTASYLREPVGPHGCMTDCPLAEYWLQVERKPGGRRRWFRVTAAQYHCLPVGSMFIFRTIRGRRMAILVK
ncbi:MAG TPA: hypothetical protein VFT16_01380 [Candidatus Saccharimonadales bacterium]|nr:hypothetical protein [Candidatus Saccharimonadales bacterium]